MQPTLQALKNRDLNRSGRPPPDSVGRAASQVTGTELNYGAATVRGLSLSREFGRLAPSRLIPGAARPRPEAATSTM